MAWAPDYATTAELKAQLRISDTADDAQLALAITAASRAIDIHTGRQFGVSTAVERFYTARYDRTIRRWVVDVDDLMSVDELDPQVQDVDGVDVGAIDAYTLQPRNAAQNGQPWTHLVVRPTSAYTPTGRVDEVAITALWGWTAVPTPIKEACLLQASRFHARRDSPFGIAGSPDLGSELRLLAKVDPDVAVALRPYVKWWAAA